MEVRGDSPTEQAYRMSVEPLQDSRDPVGRKASGNGKIPIQDKFNLRVLFAATQQTGTGVEQDLEQAFAYYRKGAEREDLNSLCRLARCYALGIGTRKDREKASALAQEILSRDWEESGELEDYGARAELEALRALWKELEPEKP